jgi:hypothetical protein
MIVAALVCLLVVTSIVGSMLHSAMRARRELHVERDCRQAELLIYAGASRAASRLAAEPGFAGDTWELPAESIVGRGAGRVKTEVSPASDGGPTRIRIVAEYPIGRNFPIRRTRTFEIAAATAPLQE